MAYLPGMSEFQASDYASELLDILTEGDELHGRAVLKGIEGSRITANVAFSTGLDKSQWLEVVVAFSDTITGTSAYVSSKYSIVDGVVSLPKLYFVSALQGSGNIERLNKLGYPADAVLERMIPRMPKQFHQPIARGLQVLQKLEIGLKAKFES